MGTNIEVSKHRAKWPNLGNSSAIEVWRQAKAIEDKVNAQAEKDMTDAFGCHGEPIANAISDTLWRLYELVPPQDKPKAKRGLLVGFQKVCDEMTDVRGELDSLIDKMANEHKQEGWDEAVNNLPSGDCADAGDYGVTLDSSLEYAFECGVNAISGYLDDVYPESVSVGMDDL